MAVTNADAQMIAEATKSIFADAVMIYTEAKMNSVAARMIFSNA